MTRLPHHHHQVWRRDVFHGLYDEVMTSMGACARAPVAEAGGRVATPGEIHLPKRLPLRGF